MVKIADIGNFETVPPFVAALLAGDVAALDSALAEGCDIETAIVLGPHTKEPRSCWRWPPMPPRPCTGWSSAAPT